jgi:TonB family protein
MTTLPGYFLEANFYLLAFLVFYFLLLRKETQFVFSRAYLLAAMGFSLLFPLVSLPADTSPPFVRSITHSFQSFWLPEVVVSSGSVSNAAWEWLLPTDARTVIVWVYLIGLAVFLGLFCIRLIRLVRLIRQARMYRWQRCRVADSDTDTGIFSFFRFIFIGTPSPLQPEEKENILRHEAVHVAKWHSVDILLSQLIGIVFWFNPFIRLYQKALVQVHEFEADARSVGDENPTEYCQLLARMALQSAGVQLANHFNQSLTLQRITMMQTMKKKMPLWKIAVLIVLFPMAFLIASCQKQAVDEVAKPDARLQTNAESPKSLDGVIFTVVEKMPEFPGGFPAFSAFLGEHILYPKESLEKGVEGTVFLTFVIDEQGKIIDPKVTKSLDAACDQEALRVIGQSPKWIPGMQNGVPVKVQYMLPIKFAQSDNQRSTIKPDQIQTVDKQINLIFFNLSKNGKSSLEGIVQDKAGNPLIGASLILAGTNTGTTTDQNGNFTLEVQEATGELAVSYVGYETRKLRF